MSDQREVRGVVVAHGSLAAGLVDAVRSIAGAAADSLHPISNHGRNPEALRSLIDNAAGDGPAVVFADLSSGSCGLAAMATCSDRGQRAVLCGVNLPMLLDFVFHREMALDDLVDRLIDKGRDGIRPMPKSA